MMVFLSVGCSMAASVDGRTTILEIDKGGWGIYPTDGSGRRPSRSSGGTEGSKRSASDPGGSPSRPHPAHSLPGARTDGSCRRGSLSGLGTDGSSRGTDGSAGSPNRPYLRL